MVSKLRKKLDIKAPDSETSMYTIGILADILKVHPRTLKIYHIEGFLVPSQVSKNRRLYSYNDIEKFKLIRFLIQEHGLNLAGIKMLFQVLAKFNVSPDKYMELIEELEIKYVR